jgi:hypothetical protein
MGLSIGSASIAASAAGASGINRSSRLGAPRPSGEEANLVPQAEAPPVQAGFGENTLSPSSAALQTLDQNLAVAEELVPTMEELRERAVVLQAERIAAAPASRPPEQQAELRRRESVRPEPDPAVQNFVRDSGSVEEPVAGEPAAAPQELVTPADSESPTPGPSESPVEFTTPTAPSAPAVSSGIDFLA